MSDDKSKKTAPQHAPRVNVHEHYEVLYWAKRFNCSTEQLKAAVAKVGVMAKDVEAQLRKRGIRATMPEANRVV